jgi:hypothetical protein
VLHVLQVVLLCPFLALVSRSGRQISTFREDDEPHRIVGLVQLPKMLLKSPLIFLPVPRQEDEVIKLSAPTDDGDISERFFQDDVDEAMHTVCICDPPQIQPVSVQLMVSHENHAVSEVALQTSILPLCHLANHTGVAAHSDNSWRPPLSETRDKNREALLGVCHVAIVELRINELKRRAQEL